MPMKMYIWRNCLCPGTDVVGKGTSRQDAFTRLNPRCRSLVTMSDTCEEGEITPGMWHNMITTIRRR